MMQVENLRKWRSAEETKVAIIEVESITERIIVEADPLLGLGPILRLSPNLCSNPPKQAPELPLPTQDHRIWITAKANNTHPRKT